MVSFSLQLRNQMLHPTDHARSAVSLSGAVWVSFQKCIYSTLEMEMVTYSLQSKHSQKSKPRASYRQRCNTSSLCPSHYNTTLMPKYAQRRVYSLRVSSTSDSGGTPSSSSILIFRITLAALFVLLVPGLVVRGCSCRGVFSSAESSLGEFC